MNTPLRLQFVCLKWQIHFQYIRGNASARHCTTVPHRHLPKYILLMELTSNLRKFQRREYYRLSCALDMDSRLLEKEEIQAIEKKDNYLVPGLPLKRSIIVDISGGGIRFVGDYAYDLDSMICCRYHLVIDGRDKEYMLVARVISVRELEDKKGIFEHRAQYVNINTLEREEIIRFIFEEERKNRKREKGL